MRKKGKNIGGWFILRSVGNEAVDLSVLLRHGRQPDRKARKPESDTILHNGYYRVAVSLAGLTGQDVSATITVAD